LPIVYSARDYGFYSRSGNVGSRSGHAVGWAMASAYSEDDKIALDYIGEETTAEGDFHEALTFAFVYHQLSPRPWRTRPMRGNDVSVKLGPWDQEMVHIFRRGSSATHSQPGLQRSSHNYGKDAGIVSQETAATVWPSRAVRIFKNRIDPSAKKY
jgi:hypothetical protein